MACVVAQGKGCWPTTFNSRTTPEPKKNATCHYTQSYCKIPNTHDLHNSLMCVCVVVCLLLEECVVCVVVHFSIAGACVCDHGRCLQCFVVVRATCVESDCLWGSGCVGFFHTLIFICEFLPHMHSMWMDIWPNSGGRFRDSLGCICMAFVTSLGFVCMNS